MTECVYADGGVIGQNPSAAGGVYAWIRVDLTTGAAIAQGSGYLTPGDVCRETVSNNHAEYYAVLDALEALPDGWSGTICSDSLLTLGRYLGGWKLTNLPLAWLRRTTHVRMRLGALQPLHVAGHPTKADLERGTNANGRPVSAWNVRCDEECTRLSRAYRANTG